jgi:hypothetical protein
MRTTQTDNPPGTGSTQPERHCPGFDSTLPSEALDELLRRRGSAKTARKAANSRQSMPALSGIGALFLVVALIGLGSWFSSDKQAQTAAAQPTPAPASTPTATAAAAAWREWAAQPNQPVYREWVPQAGGWILANAQCVPIRGSFIADPAPRAMPAVPRAELVSMPVLRATLVEN